MRRAGPRHAATKPVLVRRLLTALVALAGTFSAVLPAGRPAAAQTPSYAARSVSLDEPVADGLQEVLLDLRVGRVAGRTVRALTDERGQALIPAGALLTMGEVDFSIDEAGVLRALLHPGRRAVILDPGAREAVRAGERVEVAGGSVVRHEGELFVAVPLLEALFDLVVRVNWTDLSATVLDAEALPLGRRLAREARHRALTATERDERPGEWADVAGGPLGGAVIDWALSSNLDDPSASTAYQVGGAGRVLGGGLRATGRSLGPASGGRHRVDVTYQNVFADRGWLTQLRLGDGFVTGPRVRSARGVALTNAPFVRPSFFGTDALTGRAGPGWEVELRRAGRTLDLTRADERGAFALDIPLSYGDNPVQVVAFGPHGEVVTSERLVLLGSGRLPGGDFEWGLSGGECRDASCGTTGNLDLRYGLTDRWTLRGGIEAFSRERAPTLWQPYISAVGALLPGLEVSGERLHHGFSRAGLTYAPSPRIRARAAHTRFDRGVRVPVLHDERRLHTTEADVFLRPLSVRSRWLLRASIQRQELTTGTLSLLQAHTSFQAGGTSFELGVRGESDSPGRGPAQIRTFPSVAVDGLVPLPAGAPMWVRGEMEWLDSGALRRMQARIGYQITPDARLEVSTGWLRRGGSTLSVSLSADLSSWRSTTLMSARTASPTRVTQISEGTVQWDEGTRRLTASPGPGLERGGISGYVFVDENGNGLRDLEERGLEDVRIVVGGRTTRTDSRGRHVMRDLVPFQSVTVWADTSSLQDPRLVPTRGEVRVSVPPASFGRLDIPLVPAHELMGQVVIARPDGDVPLAHAELELRKVGAGAVRPVRAFSDGVFYETGLTHGSWELRVAPGSLGDLGVAPELPAYRFWISPGVDAPGPEPVLIRLIPLPDPIDGDGMGRR